MHKSYKYDINNRSPLAFTICKKNGPTEHIFNVKLEDLSIKLLFIFQSVYYILYTFHMYIPSCNRESPSVCIAST